MNEVHTTGLVLLAVLWTYIMSVDTTDTDSDTRAGYTNGSAGGTFEDRSYTPGKYCTQMELNYSDVLKDKRHVWILGVKRNVSVQWGVRSPSRAAAALLVVALRHVSGYQDIELIAGERKLCDLVNKMPPINMKSSKNKVVIHVGAEWTGQDGSCHSRCPKDLEVCNVAGSRLNILGEAPPTTLHLHVHLSPEARNDPICARAHYWDFYENTSYFDHCGFDRDVRYNFDFDDTKLPTSACISTPEECVPVFIPPDWIGNYSTGIELAARINASHLPLRLVLLKSDLSLRRLLANASMSFLFVDYHIWSQHPRVRRVHLPSCLNDSICHYEFKSTNTWRVADSLLLMKHAPKIFNVVRQFAPSPDNLRDVLEREASGHDISSIEEAACAHVLANPQNMLDFQEWALAADRGHWLHVLHCQEEYNYLKNHTLYQIIANETKIPEFHLSISLGALDCRDTNNINEHIIQMTKNVEWTRTVAVLGMGDGVPVGAMIAEFMETHLVLYDVPPNATHLGHVVRTSTGKLQPLVRATRKFLKNHGWSRLAVISEKTILAKDFSDMLFEDGKLGRKEIELNTITKSLAPSILHHFKDEKAPGRVFLINTGPDAAAVILCAASDQNMTSDSYVFIVREWQKPTCKLKDIRHFTVTYSWRGGDDSALPEEAKERKALRDNLNNFYNGSWPPLVAPLVDAVLLAVYATTTALRNKPSLQHDLHYKGSTRVISESFSNGTVAGVVQNLKQKNFALEKPLIFVYAFNGMERDLLAVWRDDGVATTVVKSIKEAYGNKLPPPDGSRTCYTKKSGNLYDPECSDTLIFSLIALQLMLIMALFMARRIRMKKLKERERTIYMRLLARCERTATALANHLIERSALEQLGELGRGHFGCVRLGILQLSHHKFMFVAVKALRDDAVPAEEAEFLREACVLANLSHDHIVKLVGVCAADGPPLLLMEHAHYGDLLRYLRERRHLAERAEEMTPLELTRLAREAASALEYIALKKYVHRDVRAANCLVSDERTRTLKLADFGLARGIGSNAPSAADQQDDDYKYVCHRRGMFPVPWMAPESLQQGVFSCASDVWALGVLLLEIATLGARPFGAWTPPRVLGYVRKGGHPPMPIDVSYHTREVLEMCWHGTPESRPSAAQVREYLTSCPTAIQPALRPAWPDQASEVDDNDPVTDSGFGERDPFDWPLVNDPHVV